MNPNASGSIWRKWDLHVHSPASDSFSGTWEQFETQLKNADCEVVGINDYFSVEGYKKIKEKIEKGGLDIGGKKIFPVVEFRMTESVQNKNTTTNGAVHFNFHIIFNDSIEIVDIENLIKGLASGGTKISSDYDDKAKLKDKKVSLESLLADLNGDEKFKNNFLLWIPYDEYGGIDEIDPNSDAWIKGNYIKRADILGSSRQKQIDFFLWKSEKFTQEQFTNWFLCRKACIKGSDSHSHDYPIGKLQDKDSKPMEKYCWIKADPTFDGLKQIIYEPDERIKIQQNNPYEDRNKIFFNSVKLSGSTNFILPDFELSLNRELVALIGGRGSGKSALLESFAFLNEEHLKVDQNDKKKIIEYYRDNEGRSEPPPAFSLNTTLVDKDNTAHDFSKNLDDYTNLELPFLYLGQEQLSGIATNDFELTRTVCQLIGIDVNEIGQESLISKGRTVLSDVDNTNKLLEDIVARYVAQGYKEKSDIETWIKEYLAKLIEQQKRLSSKETRTILEDINKKTEQGLKLKDLNEKADGLLLELKDISVNHDIKNFNLQLKKLYATFPQLTPLDPSDQVKALQDLQKQIKTDMDELRKEIVKQKQELIKQGIKEDVNSLLQASENLQKQINGVEKDLQNYVDGQARLKSLHKQRSTLLSDIKKSLEQLKGAITSAFVEFQQSRVDSSDDEKELFDKIIQGIGVEGQIVFNQKSFAKAILSNFIDNRKVTNETDLRKIIAGANTDGTAKEITFENLSLWIQTDLTLHNYFNRGGLKGMTEFIFTQWPEYLTVKAIAKLNGKPTEVLSIGQRGTLLLKVYLATSTAKQVFIIDQPEDNLDNSFIMHELVPLIRRAKRARQIIMSTHNANLVVNADAEQVVVAKLDQGLGYISGSIENPEINKNIRDILEGGEEAFRQRERKYLLVK